MGGALLTIELHLPVGWCVHAALLCWQNDDANSLRRLKWHPECDARAIFFFAPKRERERGMSSSEDENEMSGTTLAGPPRGLAAYSGKGKGKEVATEPEGVDSLPW